MLAQANKSNFPVFKLVVFDAAINDDGIDASGITVSELTNKLIDVDIGVANAVLIDRSKKVFATNAHVVTNGDAGGDQKHYIYLPHAQRYFRAQYRQDWCARNGADLAYLRIPGADLSSYAPLARRIGAYVEYEDLQIMGHRARYIDGNLTLEEDFIMASGCTLPAQHARKRKGSLLRFIVGSREATAPGMSGSLLIDREENILGIVCEGGGSWGYGVRATELKYDHIFNAQEFQSLRRNEPWTLRGVCRWLTGKSPVPV